MEEDHKRKEFERIKIGICFYNYWDQYYRIIKVICKDIENNNALVLLRDESKRSRTYFFSKEDIVDTIFVKYNMNTIRKTKDNYY
ncbi:7720_t:CDS:1, partial [Scutellospora calospora]